MSRHKKCAIRTRFTTTRSSLSRALTILKFENLVATEKLRPHLIAPSKRVQPRATKAAHAAADVAINGQVANFAALKNPSDEQLLDHLLPFNFAFTKKVSIIGMIRQRYRLTLFFFAFPLGFCLLHLSINVSLINLRAVMMHFTTAPQSVTANVAPQMSIAANVRQPCISKFFDGQLAHE